MKVAFVHPDLGIGGAERLIVDAAVALQKRGHDVVVYTSHYSPTHCFEETKQLNIVIKGDFLPRSLFGYFHLLFATIRCIYLAIWMFLVCPHNYNVIIVDQISFSMPILRHCAEKILFYCHFPDKLLAPKAKSGWLGSWRRAYRWYFDRLEEKTIGMAHKVLVNSRFTGTRFSQAFPSLRIKADVLHPAIATSCYDKPWDSESAEIKRIQSERMTLFSLNRFERKKNIELALQAFIWLKDHIEPERFSKLRLVIAGGYDPRVKENIEYLEEIRHKCVKSGLSHFTVFPGQHATPATDVQVLFLPSITENQRNYLMHNSFCLLYTPSFEHFGIVPVEAMYCGLPVVAVNNGGPRETVINNITGFLCESNGPSFGSAIMKLLERTDVDPTRMAMAAKKHVKAEFTMVNFADKLESILHSLFTSGAAMSDSIDRYSGLVPEAKIAELVQGWLREDCPNFDVAGAVVYGKQATAQILCKADGVLCGKPFVQKIFETLNCRIKWLRTEGDHIIIGDKNVVVAEITGEARNLLLGERVALNILARASAIATKARRISEQLEKTGFTGKLAGTRKTTPGFRIVEKYAMIVGGCDPHRYDLSSMIMLKDNHIDISGTIRSAVEATKGLKSFSQKIEVECSTYEQAIEALESGADVVMLDNTCPKFAKEWSHDIKKTYPNAIIEVSGGVTESSIQEYTGEPGRIDIISMGSLTQDIRHVDFSMRINIA